ncbi:unnamed protein product, partial [Brassica rapa subsp. trilocularis]
RRLSWLSSTFSGDFSCLQVTSSAQHLCSSLNDCCFWNLTVSPSPNKIMLTCPMMNLSKHGDSPHQSSRLDPGKNHLITRARPLIILFAKTPNGKRAQACRNRGKSSSKYRF